MAPKYSPDTEAIIERLKIEGDLIRNSDNNSMRSVNLKLDRFENVFKSINEGIILQSSAMQASVKMAQDQAEFVKRKEDFDDLKRDETTKKETKSKDKRDKSLIKGIASAMSMKNMRNALLGAGGLAAGGLIAKGFIGEKYPEFSEDMATAFRGLKESFANLDTTMANLNDLIAQTSEDIESFKNNIAVKLAVLLASIPLGFAVTRGLAKGIPAGVKAWRGPRAGDAGLAEAKAIKEAQERAAREAAEVAARRAGGEAGQELTEALAKRSAAITQLVIEQDRLVMEAMGVRPDTILPNGNKTVAGMFTSPGAPNINVIDLGDGNFRYQNMDAGGTIMKNATAVSRLSTAGLGPDGLPSVGSAAPRPQVGGGRGNGRLQMNALRNDRAAAQAMKDAGVKLAGKYVKIEAGKITVKAIPVAGAVIGLGFAAYSWYIGDTTTRNIELASVVLPSVLGGIALDLVAATTSVFFHVTKDMYGVGQTYNQMNPAHPPLWWAIMVMIVEEVEKNIERASHNPHAHRGGTELEMRAAEMAAAELAAGGGMPPTGMGANPDIGNMSLGSVDGAPDNKLNQSAAFGGNYYTGPGGVLMFQPRNGPAIRASRKPNRAATVEGGGSGSTVVISSPNIVAPSVNYTHGGNSQSDVNVLNIGGNGGGGTGSLSPFVQ